MSSKNKLHITPGDWRVMVPAPLAHPARPEDVLMSLLTRKLNERIAALQGLVAAQQREIEALHDLADARAQVIEAMAAGYAAMEAEVDRLRAGKD